MPRYAPVPIDHARDLLGDTTCLPSQRRAAVLDLLDRPRPDEKGPFTPLPTVARLDAHAGESPTDVLVILGQVAMAEALGQDLVWTGQDLRTEPILGRFCQAVTDVREAPRPSKNAAALHLAGRSPLVIDVGSYGLWAGQQTLVKTLKALLEAAAATGHDLDATVAEDGLVGTGYDPAAKPTALELGFAASKLDVLVAVTPTREIAALLGVHLLARHGDHAEGRWLDLPDLRACFWLSAADAAADIARELPLRATFERLDTYRRRLPFRFDIPAVETVSAGFA